MDIEIYKVELGGLSMAYIRHDDIFWDNKSLYPGPYYRASESPVHIGAQKISSFYIARRGYRFYEYFSGLPVEDSPGAYIAFSPVRAIHVPVPIISSKKISASELKLEAGMISPKARVELISALSEIYRMACREAELFEQKRLSAEKAALLSKRI